MKRATRLPERLHGVDGVINVSIMLRDGCQSLKECHHGTGLAQEML
jgi:hypothetical protein